MTLTTRQQRSDLLAGFTTALDRLGGLHDCVIEAVGLDYARRAVTLRLADLNAGLVDAEGAPGRIVLSDVDASYCHLPFVGGEVRIEDATVTAAGAGVTLDLGLTTTEWLPTAEFRRVQLRVTFGRFSVVPDGD